MVALGKQICEKGKKRTRKNCSQIQQTELVTYMIGRKSIRSRLAC